MKKKVKKIFMFLVFGFCLVLLFSICEDDKFNNNLIEATNIAAVKEEKVQSNTSELVKLGCNSNSDSYEGVSGNNSKKTACDLYDLDRKSVV